MVGMLINGTDIANQSRYSFLLSLCWASTLSPYNQSQSFRVGVKSYLFSWWDRLDYGEFFTLALGVQPYLEAMENF